MLTIPHGRSLLMERLRIQANVCEDAARDPQQPVKGDSGDTRMPQASHTLVMNPSSILIVPNGKQE